MSEVGGLPEGVLDMWEVTGKRQIVKFTWEVTKNDNLEWSAPFRPKCRFDRMYFRHGNKKRIKPVYFELTGLKRLSSCKRFCSDHWGILGHFDLINT